MGGRGGGSPGNRGNAAQASASAEDRVVAAVRALRAPGLDWANIDGVRERMGGTRAEQDATLMSMVRNRQIRLIPEENRKTISSRLSDAAINVSGEMKHLVGVWADIK